MQFMEISDQLQEWLEKVRIFMEQEIYPLEQRENRFDDIETLLNEKRQKARELGLWTPHLSPDWGGPGFSLTEFAHISEILGRSPFGHYVLNCQAPDIGNMEILIKHGTPEQHERFLKPLIRGDIRSCFAMTEPEHAGSNPVMMSTTSELDGDEYVINGHKWFASSADGAAFAIVMAVTHPEAESPYQRASMIIVPTDTPGFNLVRNIPVMGHSGRGYFSHGEIRFENCRVPRENLLGPEGAGFAMAQERLGPGRIHHCMRWIGICERAFELMCEYAARRELAPGKPLASRQMVQNWVAECRAEIDAARMLVLRTADRIDREGDYAARVDISLIKFYVANVLQKTLDRALQVHGGLGMTDDTPLAFWFRHERAARIYDGPDEVHKTRVAKMILRQFGARI